MKKKRRLREDCAECIMMIEDTSVKGGWRKCGEKASCENGCEKLCWQHARQLMYNHWPGSAGFNSSASPERELELGEINPETPIFSWDDTTESFHHSRSCRDPNAFGLGEWSQVFNEKYNKIQKKKYNEQFQQQDTRELVYTPGRTPTMMPNGDIRIMATARSEHQPSIVLVSNSMWNLLQTHFKVLNEQHNETDPTMQVFPPDLPLNHLIMIITYYQEKKGALKTNWTTTPPWEWEWFKQTLQSLRCVDNNLQNWVDQKLDVFNGPEAEWIILLSSNGSPYYISNQHQFFIGSSILQETVNSLKQDTLLQEDEIFKCTIQLKIPSKTLDSIIAMSEGIENALLHLTPTDVIALAREWISFNPNNKFMWQSMFAQFMKYLESKSSADLYQLTGFWAKTIDHSDDPLVGFITLLHQISNQTQHVKGSRDLLYNYFPNFLRNIEEIPMVKGGEYTLTSLDNPASSDKHRGFIGKGAFGDVYLYTNPKTKELVAIKKLRNVKKYHPYLLREINILILVCGHENVLKILNVFRDDEYIYLITPYRSHGTVDDLIKKKQRLAMKTAKQITYQALRGLKWSHLHGVIHADIKPENLLLIPSNKNSQRIEIIDYGSSKITFADKPVKITGHTVTVYYRAPELFRNSPVYTGYYTQKIDSWAVGIMILELLTGRPPFKISKRHRDAYFQKHKEVNNPNTIQNPEKKQRAWEEIFAAIVLELRFPTIFDDDVFIVSRTKIQQYLGRYGRKHIDESLLDLLVGLLNVNQEERMSVTDALDHPWFHGLTIVSTAINKKDCFRQFRTTGALTKTLLAATKKQMQSPIHPKGTQCHKKKSKTRKKKGGPKKTVKKRRREEKN